MSFISPGMKSFLAKASMVALGSGISIYAYWPRIRQSFRTTIAQYEPDSTPSAVVDPLARVHHDPTYVDKYPRIVADSSYEK